MAILEQTILKNLLNNESFTRKVLPYVKKEYFSEPHYEKLFEKISNHAMKYETLANKAALKIAIEEDESLPQSVFQDAMEFLDEVDDTVDDLKWITDQTEEFCKESALTNAVRKSILVVNGEDKKTPKSSLPEILSDALAISFDSHIGHDYIEDFEARFEFYHRTEEKLPFDIDILNKITGGGIIRKTLNVLMAGTGVGKTMFMTHDAAAKLMFGYNVLYLTAEMAEEKISERIDANMMDVKINELKHVSKDSFRRKIGEIAQKAQGRLIVKEYPTSSASVNAVEALLRELKIKKGFVPDIIYLDYLNIFASARYAAAANVNSYNYVKSIAEEFRGLAMKHNLAVFTATQVNRTGFGASDFGLTETSESFGLPATADFFLAGITTDEFEAKNQLLFKQLKNRYGPLDYYNKFLVGIDRSKMRIYDLEDSAQDGLGNQHHEEVDDIPVMDKGDYTLRDKFEKINWEEFK